jgi:hypothetical protein
MASSLKGEGLGVINFVSNDAGNAADSWDDEVKDDCVFTGIGGNCFLMPAESESNTIHQEESLSFFFLLSFL